MIFPDWGVTPTNEAQRLPLCTEWAMDWETGSFALRDGKPYTVTGNDALRIWVRLALQPENYRFRFSAHSADYGNQLSHLLGRCGDGVWESQACRDIQETLLVSPYIRAVDGFSVTRTGSKAVIAFTVHTVYDHFSETTEVDLT